MTISNKHQALAWQRPHIVPGCYPQGDLFISGPHPEGSSRSLSLPSGSAWLPPTFAVKSATFAGPGKSKNVWSQGQSFSQLPNKRVPRASRGPRAPGPALAPSPPFAEPQRGAHLPPAACPHARVALPTPVRRRRSPCPEPPTTPCPDTERQGRPKRPPDGLTPRRPPEAGAERLSAPPEGVGRGLSSPGALSAPDTLSPRPPHSPGGLSPRGRAGSRGSREEAARPPRPPPSAPAPAPAPGRRAPRARRAPGAPGGGGARTRERRGRGRGGRGESGGGGWEKAASAASVMARGGGGGSGGSGGSR